MGIYETESRQSTPPWDLPVTSEPLLTGAEAIGYIHSKGWTSAPAGLRRIRELMDRLGNPERQLQVVHIAGTNGKGSTSAMLDAVLRRAGYRVGLYTSPYIHRFQERIQVDGRPIGDRELGEATQLVRAQAEAMEESPTEFEILAAVAFVHFARSRCQLVVLEVGMGGRLDATNVIPTPRVAVVTNIGLDHTRQLGDTVEAIAGEKAGIIKAGGQVVLYPQQPSVEAVIAAACDRVGATLHRATSPGPVRHSLEGQVLEDPALGQLRLALLGDHQRHNAGVVLETLRVLAAQGYRIPREAILQGLAEVRWPGRFEVVCRRPTWVVDGGHNPQCAQAVADNLDRYFPGRQAVLLTGVMGDKDYPALYRTIDPYVSRYITVTPDIRRALPAGELAAWLARYGKPVRACATVEEGVEAALEAAGPQGLVLTLGSLYLVGPVRACFGLELAEGGTRP